MFYIKWHFYAAANRKKSIIFSCIYFLRFSAYLPTTIIGLFRGVLGLPAMDDDAMLEFQKKLHVSTRISFMAPKRVPY